MWSPYHSESTWEIFLGVFLSALSRVKNLAKHLASPIQHKIKSAFWESLIGWKDNIVSNWDLHFINVTSDPVQLNLGINWPLTNEGIIFIGCLVTCVSSRNAENTITQPKRTIWLTMPIEKKHFDLFPPFWMFSGEHCFQIACRYGFALNIIH